ncbi:hypothetical protein AC579_1824 [Pseudocercospora musae]|uniref:Uncharacterized protein n=1 Tax=Pseudocercospora musae TaxID=113226 RepID=A0A139IDL8_9PEZI|nr:hypothetical protein AC579_1824 [Pseudocercospora musae]
MKAHGTNESRKQTVTSGEQTLQQLEAKLRETEERLARVSRGTDALLRVFNLTGADRASTNDRQAAAAAAAADGPPKPSPLAGQLSRPPTAPQNDDRPTNGGSEYVMVDRHDGQQNAQRGYG